MAAEFGDAKDAKRDVNAERVNSAVQDVLRRCGAIWRDGEDAFAALRRRAREQGWLPRTLNRWIEEVRDLLAVQAEAAFGNLKVLNGYLRQFGLEEQRTASAACKVLKANVYINIYDLLVGDYDKRQPSLAALRKYTLKNKKVFPLERAKTEGLRAFLQVIMGRR